MSKTVLYPILGIYRHVHPETKQELENLKAALAAKEVAHHHTKVKLESTINSLQSHARQLAATSRAYDELIFAVASRFPDETRHETALRYIQEAENRCNGSHQAGEGSDE